MGWFLRKAFNFGPFRLNVSKSGLGTSTGVTGLRVGTRPDGQDYLFAGRDGLYLRENLGSKPEPTVNSQAFPSPPDAARGSPMSQWSRYADEFVGRVSLTLDGLVEPFTVGMSLLRTTIDITPRRFLDYAAVSVCWKFAIGAPLTDELVVFLQRMAGTFTLPDEFPYNNASVGKLRREYDRIFRNDSVGNLAAIANSLERILGPLQAYDHLNGSAHAKQAKALWIAVADAVLKSSGGPRPEDTERLEQFNVYLEGIALEKPILEYLDQTHRPTARATAHGIADEPVAHPEQSAAGSRLQQAKDMLDKGLISAEDYEAVKRRVLSDI